MNRKIQKLQLEGNLIGEPDSKHLCNDIFELRAEQGNNISRTLYFFMAGRKAVLTNGFIKKTQKTPVSVIELAEKYREDYKQQLKEKDNG